MDKPARVQLFGSGSAIAKAGAHEGPLGFRAGAVVGRIGDLDEAIRLGVVCYTAADGTVFAHHRDAPDGQELSRFCERMGIPESGRLEIERGIAGMGHATNEFVFCAPKIAQATILHLRTPPYGLKMIAPNRFCLHVSKEWHKRAYGAPPGVEARMAYLPGKVTSRNHAERFLTRPFGNGSDGAGNVVPSVGKAAGARVSPWPEALLGFAPMVAVDTYTGAGPEKRIPFNAWLGPCEGGAIDFYGDGEETAKINGFADGRPSAEADDVDPEDPAAWFADFFGGATLLPPPTADTGAYRPGVYYDADGNVAILNLGQTHGHTTNGTIDGYPVLRVDYPISVVRPPLEPGEWIRYEAKRDGETVLADLEIQTLPDINPVLFFEERAAWDDPADFLRLEISVSTGWPNPCPKRDIVAQATFYSDGFGFDLIPEGDAPTPEIVVEGRWTRVTVPLDGQLEEAGSDHWAARQRKTFVYRLAFFGASSLKVYPKAVFAWGDDPVTPDGAFERFEPFPLPE